jgi:hypothetical protein
MRTSSKRLENHLESGRVYRREALLPFSNALDRDLKRQERLGTLEKVGAGLYYCPRKSRFGLLPPNDHELVSSFLKEDPFLLFTWNDYNTLGLGLTQLYNSVVVYNRKRHETIVLDGKTFEFRRPTKGFPSELSKEYLLVDLMNNLSLLADDVDKLRERVKQQLKNFDDQKVLSLAKLYGKVGTRKFFEGLIH